MSVFDSSRKDRSAPVSIPYTSILLIQNNPSTYSFLSFLSYKFISFSLTSGFKKLIIEIEENDNVNSNIEIQLLSSQQSLQPALQIP